MAVVWETAFVSVKAADVTVKDLPHAREWRRVGHWQNERLEEKRPLFLNLSNYGQAGFQSTFVKSIQGKDDDREILCYAQRNPMWQDMVHRKVRGKRSVALKVIMNDEKTKVALVWSNAVTGDQLHVLRTRPFERPMLWRCWGWNWLQRVKLPSRSPFT